MLGTGTEQKKKSVRPPGRGYSIKDSNTGMLMTTVRMKSAFDQMRRDEGAVGEESGRYRWG